MGYRYYYWRDNNGVEIDLICEGSQDMLPIEIKSAQTYTSDFSKNLKRFMSYSGTKQGLILYDGNPEFKGTDNIDLQNWQKFLLKN